MTKQLILQFSSPLSSSFFPYFFSETAARPTSLNLNFSLNSRLHHQQQMNGSSKSTSIDRKQVTTILAWIFFSFLYPDWKIFSYPWMMLIYLSFIFLLNFYFLYFFTLYCFSFLLPLSLFSLLYNLRDIGILWCVDYYTVYYYKHWITIRSTPILGIAATTYVRNSVYSAYALLIPAR